MAVNVPCKYLTVLLYSDYFLYPISYFLSHYLQSPISYFLSLYLAFISLASVSHIGFQSFGTIVDHLSPGENRGRILATQNMLKQELGQGLRQGLGWMD